MKYKFLFLIIILLIIPNVQSISEKAINASIAIEEAKESINFMIEREIPINRVNESLQETIRLYEGELALERLNQNYKYDKIYEKVKEINSIKEASIKAADELKIFQETYEEYSLEINLSGMDKEYNEIIKSFQEERFEDTLPLIDIGYDKMSEVQSQQTTLRLFYDATSKNIKLFLKNNWLKILITGIVLILFLLFSRKAISKYFTYKKVEELNNRKIVLHELIKKIQRDYFDKTTISEDEYSIKLNKFTEMLRDIDRELPLLREEMIKLNNTNIKSIKKKVLEETNIKKVSLEVDKSISKKKRINDSNKLKRKGKKKR